MRGYRKDRRPGSLGKLRGYREESTAIPGRKIGRNGQASSETVLCFKQHFRCTRITRRKRLFSDWEILSSNRGKALHVERKKIHPDDLRTCELTQASAHFEFMTTNGACRLAPWSIY